MAQFCRLRSRVLRVFPLQGFHYQTTTLRRDYTTIIYQTIRSRRFSNGIVKMVKPASEVIPEFQHYVNMTAPELTAWLKTGNSKNAGLMKEGATESVGHESGGKIVDILTRNPGGDEAGYTDEDIAHMRKVVAYCKRHIAGEQSAMLNENSKSCKSLKNWGHDAIKAAAGN